MNQKRLETGASVFGPLVYDKDALEGQWRKNDLFKEQHLQLGISVEKLIPDSYINYTIYNQFQMGF